MPAVQVLYCFNWVSCSQRTCCIYDGSRCSWGRENRGPVHIVDRSLQRFSRHDCRACSRRAAGDSTSFHQDIYFSAGTRPIFNINNSKFQRAEPYLVISSEIIHFNSDPTIGSSLAGIADPPSHHPVRNRGPGGVGSQREDLRELPQVPKTSQNQHRAPNGVVLRLLLRLRSLNVV